MRVVSSARGLHAEQLAAARGALTPRDGAVHERLEHLPLLLPSAGAHAHDDALRGEGAVQARLQEVGLALRVDAHVVEAVVPATQRLVAVHGQVPQLLPQHVVDVRGALAPARGHSRGHAPAVRDQLVLGCPDGVLLRHEVLQAREQIQGAVLLLQDGASHLAAELDVLLAQDLRVEAEGGGERLVQGLAVLAREQRDAHGVVLVARLQHERRLHLRHVALAQQLALWHPHATGGDDRAGLRLVGGQGHDPRVVAHQRGADGVEEGTVGGHAWEAEHVRNHS
mmetsp:Transcript_103613/g.270606  ORF Transcript_103613/g.270606 Transcript_103613/m.270606 type:complete len:282 (+) Transcript_103613:502-1347(+)